MRNLFNYNLSSDDYQNKLLKTKRVESFNRQGMSLETSSMSTINEPKPSFHIGKNINTKERIQH